MTHLKWDPIIQQMVEESKNTPKEGPRNRLLMQWRATLEREPHHLTPHQIDEIVREVRRRINVGE